MTNITESKATYFIYNLIRTTTNTKKKKQKKITMSACIVPTTLTNLPGSANTRTATQDNRPRGNSVKICRDDDTMRVIVRNKSEIEKKM